MGYVAVKGGEEAIARAEQLDFAAARLILQKAGGFFETSCFF